MEALISSLQANLDASLFISLLLCFAGGVIASLSPCVYPLLPVVVTYVGSRSVGEKTRWKSFWLSLVYVLGMAAVYTSLGMLAALTGSFFGKISTNPWVIFAVANIFILLGLNILDVFPLPLLNLRASGSDKDRKGLLGAFLVGAASGLVASPCTVPVLGIILTYVGTTQNVLQGGSLLFSFSMGMGLLLLLAGAFSGVLTSLPKPGNWMFMIRKILGLIMLGIGEYFLIRAGQLMI